MKNTANTGTLVLEASTNTHVLHGVVESEKISDSIIKVKVKEKAKVVHGEHGTIAIESENVVKYTQQELNPVTNAFQTAFD